MKKIKHLYYIEGNDSLLFDIANTLFNAYDKEDSITVRIIYAGKGWKFNREQLYNSSEEDIIYTNDVSLLGSVAYDFENCTFPITFVDSNTLELHNLKDIHENLRCVNNIEKMYKSGLFGFFDTH